MLVEILEIREDKRAQPVNGLAITAKNVLDGLHHRRNRRRLHLVEKILLVAIVKVDGTFRDPDFLRHALHRHALEAFTADEADDRLLNALAFVGFPGTADLTCGHDRRVIL